MSSKAGVSLLIILATNLGLSLSRDILTLNLPSSVDILKSKSLFILNFSFCSVDKRLLIIFSKVFLSSLGYPFSPSLLVLKL
jgi:hypothetical protein